MIWLNQANGEDRQYVILNNWNNSAASSFDDSWNNAYVNTITQAQITTANTLAEGSKMQELPKKLLYRNRNFTHGEFHSEK
jgi:hypothetical protein